MADVFSAVIGAADLLYTLFKDLKSLSDIGDCETDTEMLALYIERTKNRLYNMDEQQLDGVQKAACNKIREVVLDAEDILDRVETLAKKKKLLLHHQGNDIVNHHTNHTDLSWPNIMSSITNKALDMVPGCLNKVESSIKEINSKLDAIEKYLQTFGLQEHSPRQLTRSMSARASGAQVNATRILGRDEDKSKVIELLLPSIGKHRIPVVSIFGMGGMGKTTLAQLIFDDKSWQQGTYSFDMRLWVSDSKKLDLKSLLKSMLKSINHEKSSIFDNLEETQLKDRLVEEINGKRFLLVLDDVKNEEHLRWTNLADLLSKGNEEGSRVLVTTRSRRVGDSMGASASTYELKRLSKEDSLQLFERFAFGNGTRDENLVQMGKCIVENCVGVPLAIRVIGSLLRGQKKPKWKLVRDSGLAKGRQITSILKMSYDDLDPMLKQCFSYCALFPKNYIISKEILTSIWKANVRFKIDEGDTIHDVCNENMDILYNRCFLEVEERFHWADDTYYKMHDLMHDLAKEVAGTEMLVDFDGKGDCSKLIIEKNIRHLSLLSHKIRKSGVLACELKGRRLRTFIVDRYSLQKPLPPSDIENLLSGCPFIRVLNLSLYHSIGHLTDSIGKLIHLRYLDLSCTDVQNFSVTELINLHHLRLAGCKALTHFPDGVGGLRSLEVLDISSCYKLKELPMAVEKLTNLRRLRLDRCHALTHLPSGMGGLTSLEILNMRYCEKLEELPMEVENLTNLRRLDLESCRALTHLPSGVGGLTSLEILNMRYCTKLEELPMEVENLTNLMYLNLSRCLTLTHLPCGVDGLTSLEKLDISWCDKLKELPKGVEKLTCLKELIFEGCWGLKEMPSGMGALLPICSPHKFIVGYPKSKHTAQLEELVSVSELKGGGLEIVLPVKLTLKGSAGDGESFLSNKKWLRKLRISWREERIKRTHSPEEEVPGNHMEDIMVKLQPPPTLEKFDLYEYKGMEFPGWVPKEDFASALPNLQQICISSCYRCRRLPPLSRLARLKQLVLCCLSSLEYIEEDVSSASFCPSLEILELWDLPELKGWCKQGLTTSSIEQDQWVVLPSFPCLVDLRIFLCPNLMVATILISFVKLFSVNRQRKKEGSENREMSIELSSAAPGGLSSSSVRSFDDICRCSGSFQLRIKEGENQQISLAISLYASPNFREMSIELTDLSIYYCSGMKTLTGLQHLTTLQQLRIERCDDFTGEVQSNSLQVAELSCKGLQSLQQLILSRLPKMERIPQGIQFLTSLEKLEIEYCDNLTGVDGELPWKGLQSLKELKLTSLPKMERLPQGIQFLTSLEKLAIEYCDNLTGVDGELPWKGLQSLEQLKLTQLPKMESLPQGIQFLTSLRELNISHSDNMSIPEWPEWVHTTFKLDDYTWKTVYRRVNNS